MSVVIVGTDVGITAGSKQYDDKKVTVHQDNLETNNKQISVDIIQGLIKALYDNMTNCSELKLESITIFDEKDIKKYQKLTPVIIIEILEDKKVMITNISNNKYNLQKALKEKIDGTTLSAQWNNEITKFKGRITSEIEGLTEKTGEIIKNKKEHVNNKAYKTLINKLIRKTKKETYKLLEKIGEIKIENKEFSETIKKELKIKNEELFYNLIKTIKMFIESELGFNGNLIFIKLNKKNTGLLTKI